MSHDNHGDHGGHGSSGGDDGCMSSHAMLFHADVCQEILFPGWKSTTVGELFGACVAVFVAAVLYEGLKYCREWMFTSNAVKQTASSQVNIAKSECQNGPCAQQKVVKHSIWSVMHGLQTMMHIIQSTMSYLLMLIFMTYNVWLCIALILGLAVGYFLFGWQKQTVVDLTEHCH